MTTKDLKKQLQQIWTVSFILIPVIGLLAFLMNNVEGFRLIPYSFDGHMVRIYVLIGLSLITISAGFFISFKQILLLKKEKYSLNKAILYKSSYVIRIGVIFGSAFFCIITYYGLNMTEILIGVPIYMLILFFDRPVSEEKLNQILN